MIKTNIDRLITWMTVLFPIWASYSQLPSVEDDSMCCISSNPTFLSARKKLSMLKFKYSNLSSSYDAATQMSKGDVNHMPK